MHKHDTYKTSVRVALLLLAITLILSTTIILVANNVIAQSTINEVKKVISSEGLDHPFDVLVYKNENNETIAITNRGFIVASGLDDTSVIQKAIEKVYSDGGGTVFIKKAVYEIKTTIKLYPGVKIKSDGAILKLSSEFTPKGGSDTNRAVLMNAAFYNLEDVNEEDYWIEGLVINGNKNNRTPPTGREKEIGIAILRFNGDGASKVIQHVVIKDVTIKNVYGHGIHLWSVRDFTIENVRIESVGYEGDNLWNGLYIAYCSYGEVRNVKANTEDYMGVKIVHCEKLTFIDVISECNRMNAFCIADEPSRDLTFIKCIGRNSTYGFYLKNNNERLTFIDCIAEFNLQRGWCILETNSSEFINIKAINNSQTAANSYDAIYLAYSCKNKIINAIIQGPHLRGVNEDVGCDENEITIHEVSGASSPFKRTGRKTIIRYYMHSVTVRQWANVPIGTSDNYGDLVELKSITSMLVNPRVGFVISGINATASEVITVKIEFVYSDNVSVSIEKSFTSDGEYWLDDSDYYALYRDASADKWIVSVKLYAKSNLDSTAATVTGRLYAYG